MKEGLQVTTEGVRDLPTLLHIFGGRRLYRLDTSEGMAPQRWLVFWTRGSKQHSCKDEKVTTIWGFPLKRQLSGGPRCMTSLILAWPAEQ